MRVSRTTGGPVQRKHRAPSSKLRRAAVPAALLLGQIALVGVLQLDWVPEASPIVENSVYVGYGGALFAALWWMRSWGRAAMVAWLLASGAVLYLLHAMRFFPDELIETKTWPDLTGVKVYVYADTFRRKMATVELRSGWLPLKHYLKTCRFDAGFSIERQGEDLVFRCDHEETRFKLVGR